MQAHVLNWQVLLWRLTVCCTLWILHLRQRYGRRPRPLAAAPVDSDWSASLFRARRSIVRMDMYEYFGSIAQYC